jgi:hypothetical protein
MPIEGVHALVPPEWIAPSAEPEALAAVAARLLTNRPEGVYERSLEFGYERAAARLLGGYGGVRPGNAT